MLKGILGWLFKGSKNSPIKEAVGLMKDLGVDTKEDKREFFHQTLDKVLDDRQDARSLYKKDAVLHKIYAMTFLLAYIGLTSWMLIAIIKHQFENISQFETGMVGSIFGYMSSKVNTVTDFLFGASDQKQDAVQSLYEANNPADRAKMRHERRMARIKARQNK